MLNNASKYALGLATFAVFAAIAADDRAAKIILVGIAIVAVLVAIGQSRSLGADLAPFVAKDAPVTTTPIDPAEAPGGSFGPMIVGIAATIGAAGGALGPRWVIVGLLAALVGAGVWTYDTFRAPGVLTVHDAKNVDNRLLGPIALPVGAFLLAITIAFCFSRVLLAVNETASWVVAFVVAATVLTILSVIAAKGPTTRIVVSLAGVGMVGVLVAGGAGASVGERDFEHKAVEPPMATLTAHNIAYDRKVIGFPANTDVELTFTNLDVDTFHNVAIYTEGEPGKPIFNGKPIDKGYQHYMLHTPKAGTYRYVCDFHPAMTGELRVSAATPQESE